MTEARPTMRDVARLCGVSAKSVSRVVNGEAGVSQGTADRILATMEELGFRRNHLARSLRQGARTGTIGLAIEDPAALFYRHIYRGVESAAREHGSLVLTASSIDVDHERDTLLTLCARRVDGLLIVAAGRDYSYLRAEQQMGTPIVFVDRPAEGIDADLVMLDNVGGARIAVEHLLQQEHRRIGLVGETPAIPTVSDRRQGYREALRDAGVTPDVRLERLGRHTVPQAAAATHELLSLDDPPTAFFATNNRSAIGVLRALANRRALRALVGFDDFELADMLSPPVSVVAYDAVELGRHAARLLFDRIDGRPDPFRRVTVPTHLVVRGSGEIRP